MILLLLFIHHAASSVLFTSALPPTSPFSTKIPFTATYTGSDSVSWSTTDNTCSKTTVNADSSEFQCSATGYHKITLTDSVGDTDYSIYTEHSPACYTWAISHTADHLYLWITDGDQANDQVTSKQFYFIGETPKVTVQCDKTLTTLTPPSFNTTLDKWQLDQTLIEWCVGGVLHIQSVPALLFGCTVADTSHSIYQSERYTLAGSTNVSSVSTKLCLDYCHSGAAVVLYNSMVYYTSDLFTSRSAFVADLDMLGSVKDCGVSYDQIVLVMDNNEVITVSKDSYSRKSTNIVDKISVNSQCKVTLEESRQVSDTLLWSSSQAQLGNENLTLPGDYDTILDAQISYIGATFLLSNGSEVNIFSMDLNAYSFSDAGMSLDCTSNCSIHALCPHTILMTDDTKLYMVAYGAESGIRVTDYSDSSPLSLDIEMITSSTSHTFAVLTTAKDIYFGYCSLTTLIYLSSVDEAEWLVFDNAGVLYYIDSSLAKHPLPLTTLLQSKVNTFWCPVQNFYTDVMSSLIFLDKFESVDILVNSQSSPFYQAAVTYQINSHSLIQTQSISDTSVYSQGVGINQHTQQVRLFEKDAASSRTGVAAMVMQSTAVDIPCTAQHSEVLYVAVGCRPSRTIRVLDKETSCPYLEHNNQTIPLPAAYTSNTVSSEYIYNYTLLGCPVVWPHDTPFVPNVWIYDGDVAVRQLPNDYILKELNNRTDYGYTQSASSVGCKRATQTWETMGDGWNKDNYASCFESDSKDYTASQQATKYEILNSTSFANISFEKHKANYTFQLTVVDPDASFCTLSAYFSVEIKDAPATSNIGVYVLFLTCALMVVVLGVSYFSYKKQILDKAKAVLEAG